MDNFNIEYVSSFQSFKTKIWELRFKAAARSMSAMYWFVFEIIKALFSFGI